MVQFHRAISSMLGDGPTMNSLLYAADLRNELQRFLSPNEWETLVLRYGLAQHAPHTVLEVNCGACSHAVTYSCERFGASRTKANAIPLKITVKTCVGFRHFCSNTLHHHVQVAQLMDTNTAHTHRVLKGAFKKLHSDTIMDRLKPYMEEL